MARAFNTLYRGKYRLRVNWEIRLGVNGGPTPMASLPSGDSRYLIGDTTSDNSIGLVLVADNLLEQDLTAEGPNERWASDITYISTRQSHRRPAFR